ncbi:MAG: leucyl aminopeptidase family protein [Planctomycetota bacterium]|jgi:leucyl aminopeptidase
MEFRAAGAPRASHKTDSFVHFSVEGARAPVSVPDPALRKAAAEARKAKEFSGKPGETLLLHGGAGGRRLLLAGLGEREKVDADALRKAAAAAARLLERRSLKRATFLVPADGDARAIVEGAGLAAYRFDQCRSKPKKAKFTHATVVPEEGAAGTVAKAVREGAAIVRAVAFARDLGNLPGNVADAVYLARRARELGGGKLTVRIHNRAAIKRLRMGAFAAVAQASQNEPRLIEVRYRGTGAGRQEMKFDMCGAAAVLGLVHLVKELQPKVNLHALVPATDNMPGGAAYRPGDIIKARNGKTIEIISTDAEGRLLLCDALAYAAEKKPGCIVDLATLTGACMVALGDAAAGLFSNDDGVREKLTEAAESAAEGLWPMPLYPRYTEMMKSPYADLKNGGGRWGGACTAAAFLQEFVAGVPWAHLDIAGTAWTEKAAGYQRKGATGYGVRLLWEFVKRQ